MKNLQWVAVHGNGISWYGYDSRAQSQGLPMIENVTWVGYSYPPEDPVVPINKKTTRYIMGDVEPIRFECVPKKIRTYVKELRADKDAPTVRGAS